MNQETQTVQTQPALTKTEKRTGGTMLRFVIGAAVIGLVLAAIVFRNWSHFGIAFLIIVPFVLLLSAPTWMARLNRRSP